MQFRKVLDLKLKIAITLRYLASESFTSLHQHYAVRLSTIPTFIPEVSQVIYDELVEKCPKFPRSKDNLLKFG